MKSSNIARLIITAISAAVISMSVTSCSSTKHATASEVKRNGSSRTSISTTPFKPQGKLPEQAQGLISEANKWLGTPYRYGGNTRSGVDCSGFVLQVYNNALDIKLPRNSAKQYEFCSQVKPSDLIAGDLVFFATSRGSSGVSHVGLYVGDGKMIHASSSKGVIVTNITDDYYKRTFVGAGRVEAYRQLLAASSTQPRKPAKADKPRETTPIPDPAPATTSPATPSVNVNDLPALFATAKPEAPTSSPAKPNPAPRPAAAIRPSAPETPATPEEKTENTASNRLKVLNSLPD